MGESLALLVRMTAGVRDRALGVLLPSSARRPAELHELEPVPGQLYGAPASQRERSARRSTREQ